MPTFIPHILPSAFAILLFVGFQTLARTCYPEIRGLGTVEPLGDIKLLVGSDLKIKCSLKEGYTGPGNSSNIIWMLSNGTFVDYNYVTIIDSRTAQLHIPNVGESHTNNYACVFRQPIRLIREWIKHSPENSVYAQSLRVESRGEDAEDDRNRIGLLGVCFNAVFVGYPPPDSTEFACLSLAWHNMTCNWTVPYNPVPTNWTLHYLVPAGGGRWGKVGCPRYIVDQKTNIRIGCFFSDVTHPTYRTISEFYNFVVDGANSLGAKSFNYKINHFSIVQPPAPTQFVGTAKDSQHISMKWTISKKMLHFPPMLYFRLLYRSEFEAVKDVFNVVDVGLNKTAFDIYELNPYTRYTLKLQSRSGAALKNRTESANLWSPPAVTTIITRPARKKVILF